MASKFTLGNVVFTQNDKGNYFFKIEGDKKTRISEAEFTEAFDKYWDEQDNPKKKRTPRAKNTTVIADVLLTEKQIDFIKHLPDTCFWENGLDSMPWVDVLCDEIGGQFAGKPMTVGAMVSTLREKGVINVGESRVNNRKSKFLALTDLGKEVAKEIGIK